MYGKERSYAIVAENGAIFYQRMLELRLFRRD
jgi:hypothetical protein